MKKPIAVFYILVLLLFSSCGGSPELLTGIIDQDPFDGYQCNTTITNNLTDSQFTSLLQSGTSSASLYRICVNPGITINTAGNVILIANTNLEIRGADTMTSKINNLEITASGANNVIKFANLNIESSTSDMALTVLSTAQVHIENSVVSATSTEAYVLDVSTTTIVNNSTFFSGDGSAVALSAGNRKITNATFTDSTFIASYDTFVFTSASSGTVSTTLKGNTFKTRSSSGSRGTYGLSISANGGYVTLNDTSTSRKNLFCNYPGTTITMAKVYDAVTSSGGSINGTFSVSGTQNGSNTAISTCP